MTDPKSRLSSLASLLPQLSSPPFPPTMLSQIYEQCVMIKQHGKQLEETAREQLNLVMVDLTRLCQDSSIELELRLRFLEMIELRSLGWDSNENLEAFYRDKYNEVVGRVDERPRDDTVINEVLEEEEEAVQEVINVGLVKVFISSTDRDITKAAKKQLEKFFSSPSSNTEYIPGPSIQYRAPPLQTPTTHQYTREALLMLANSQQSHKAPRNWTRRIQSLPRVIVKQM